MGAAARARRAAAAAGALLAALYAATAAPDLTFWDAGEFVAAFATLGIPHPPGTPLFVLAGRAWTLALGAAGVGVPLAAALLSAACTAAAGALTAWLITRWSGSAVAGVAAALFAGGMSTAWASATEAEVYAPSLLLSLFAVAAGDGAGRAPRAARGLALTAYALSLSVALHLSALVAAPVAALLAGTDARGRWRVDGLVLVGAVTVACAGAGSGRPWLAALGVAVVAAWAVARWRAPSAHPRTALAMLGVTAIGLSAVLALWVRARHDPWLNQADPSTWSRLADVVARRQYAPAPPWPRQAPWWIQLGNLFEWADWQVAFGISPVAPPSVARTSMTVAAAVLGLVGSRWHRRRDRRSWRAWALLLACGTVGVAAYLNLRPGPTYGDGVLPAGAPHEARERDYFFVLGWWAWGAWVGVGCAVTARRSVAALRAAPRRAWPSAALLLAAVPVALNWRVRNRRDVASGEVAGAFGRAVLGASPPRAVLLVAADNDTYPLWAVQAAEGRREDVTPVTVSLLGAAWYRAELARRHGLLPAALVDRWSGEASTVAAVAAAAERAGRPVVATIGAVPATGALARGWAHAGLLAVRTPSAPGAAWVAAPTALAGILGHAAVDTAGARAAAAVVARTTAPSSLRVDRALDGVDRWARRQLACPAALLAALDAELDAERTGPPTGAVRLETPCRPR